ncbi:MAG: hypothetical protein KF859_13045 [Phycisphaeraceae bacterium]|nr:hypothetical protein [Phycisphaeraceae bacterium]
MKKTLLALCLAAGAAVSVSSADVRLKLVNTQDLFDVCVVGNAFFIGNNPSTIALVGDRLFVGGYNNTSAAADLRVVMISNIFGARGFTNLDFDPDPDNAVFTQSVPGQRNFTGMDYAQGHGLLLSWDNGGVGFPAQQRLFDIDTQFTPILLEASPAGTSAAGGGGPAWDFGFGGQGFDYNGDGSIDGPLAAIVDFRGYPGSIQNFGPFGIIPRTFSGVPGLDVINGRVYDGSMEDGNGNPIAPRIGWVASGGPDRIGDNGVSNTSKLWRDIDIHPETGLIAARSTSILIGHRNANNSVDPFYVVDAGNQPFSNMQNLQIVHGVPCGGEFIVYNDRRLGAAVIPFTSAILATDFSASPVTLEFVDEDGNPLTLEDGNSAYDFSWDAANQRLAVSDFLNRKAYIFEFDCGSACGPCYADYNQDGGVDGQDVEAFFIDWESAQGCADTNEDGGVDGADVETFFLQWEAGGCD